MRSLDNQLVLVKIRLDRGIPKYSGVNLDGTLHGTLVATSVVRLVSTIELKLFEFDKAKAT